MTTRSVIPALGLVVVLGVACGPSRVAYSPPRTAPADDTRVYDASFEQTWTAVVQEFFERNIPMGTVEKDSGVIESGSRTGEIGETCDCGTYMGVPVGGYGTYGGDAQYHYRVLVQKRDDDRTAVVLRSSCNAHHPSIEGELQCRLDPKYERELREGIERRLQQTTSSE